MLSTGIVCEWPCGAALSARTRCRLILSSFASKEFCGTYTLRLRALTGDTSISLYTASTAIPIEWYPLSTYTVVPVIPLARGEHRKAATAPTSPAVNGSVMGAFFET